MELGPIYRALAHSKARVGLTVLQIALTLAVAVNCVGMIRDQRAKILRPTGIDEPNLLVVTSKAFDLAFEEPAYARNSHDEDLRALRALPGVQAAGATDQVPLSGGGSATGRRPVGSERDPVTAPFFHVGQGAVEALGVELVAGEPFDPGDFLASEAADAAEGAPPRIVDVLVTQALADELFPDGDAVGQLIAGRNDARSQNRIVGILRRMHCSWPLSDVVERAMLYPGRPGDGRQVIYLVRAEPGQREALAATIERELLRVNQGRIVEVQTMTEVKRETYGNLISVNQLLGAMIVLLLVVTSLGVVGLTAFSVTQRTRQIGTRRALGATRGRILAYFLLENWVVTTAGLVLGLFLTYGLNFALARSADVPRAGLSTVVLGMVLLWIVGAVSTLAPALRGAAVSPVVATRSV